MISPAVVEPAHSPLTATAGGILTGSWAELPAAITAGALLILLYTYAGYPLLVALWAKLAPRAVLRSGAFEPTVSVCLTIYNGEAHLAQKLRNLQLLEYPEHKLEILVFSDGSTDATEPMLRELAFRDPRIRWLSSRMRLGKPTALNRLVREARGDVLLLCDVRQILGPFALRALLEPLSDPSVGCVSGTLALSGDTGASAYWRYEQRIRRDEGRIGCMVGVSGSIYAIRRADMPELPPDILLDDMFVPLRVALRRRARIVLAESAVAHDTACDDEREYPRKVRTLAGNYQLLAKMPALLLPGFNPVWLPLVSHKLLRLVCPWALVALFCASGQIALGGGAASVERTGGVLLFAGQCACYLLALFGPRAGRLGALARTFVVLNVAAVVGLIRFVRGSQSVTW